MSEKFATLVLNVNLNDVIEFIKEKSIPISNIKYENHDEMVPCLGAHKIKAEDDYYLIDVKIIDEDLCKVIFDYSSSPTIMNANGGDEEIKASIENFYNEFLNTNKIEENHHVLNSIFDVPTMYVPTFVEQCYVKIEEYVKGKWYYPFGRYTVEGLSQICATHLTV